MLIAHQIPMARARSNPDPDPIETMRPLNLTFPQKFSSTFDGYPDSNHQLSVLFCVPNFGV
jgi:hypothetical protein